MWPNDVQAEWYPVMSRLKKQEGFEASMPVIQQHTCVWWFEPPQSSCSNTKGLTPSGLENIGLSLLNENCLMNPIYYFTLWPLYVYRDSVRTPPAVTSHVIHAQEVLQHVLTVGAHRHIWYQIINNPVCVRRWNLQDIWIFSLHSKSIYVGPVG